jgi:hypothetical protein
LVREKKPDLLVNYIALTVVIDDRQYERRIEKQGRKKTWKLNNVNSGKKMQNKSTASGTHLRSMDVDNVNRGKKKDKSKITYYNYGKTGYYKNECRTEKKD